jgi:hypothetical protein
VEYIETINNATEKTQMYDFTYLNGLTISQLEETYRWAYWRDDEHCKALAIECQRRIKQEQGA